MLVNCYGNRKTRGKDPWISQVLCLATGIRTPPPTPRRCLWLCLSCKKQSAGRQLWLAWWLQAPSAGGGSHQLSSLPCPGCGACPRWLLELQTSYLQSRERMKRGKKGLLSPKDLHQSSVTLTYISLARDEALWPRCGIEVNSLHL